MIADEEFEINLSEPENHELIVNSWNKPGASLSKSDKDILIQIEKSNHEEEEDETNDQSVYTLR